MEKLKVVLASNSENKVAEFRTMATRYAPNWEILSLNDAGISCDIQETAKTYIGNARIKANTISKLTELPVLADDSGLEIDALFGFPGLITARLGGHESPSHYKREIILKTMEGEENRNASYKSALCLIIDGEEFWSGGKCDGKIAYTELGAGYGYYQIFSPDSMPNTTFGAMEPGDVALSNHRCAAFQKLIKAVAASGKVV